MPPKSKKPKSIESLKHDRASRPNIPAAEYQSLMDDDDKHPIRIAFERRDPDLDPQLVWRGKDVMDWSDLVVQAPPLYIQELVKPKVIIDDLIRESERRAGGREAEQLDLFADFNGVAKPDKSTKFYQHDANWTNRMILGDSLQVMSSLAEREKLRGKVQCIYIDPPYGIKFNSNFQWSTTSRDVKDGKADHITREPEQVKARVSKTGLFWQFFLFENRPSATGQTRRILPPNSGELKSLGSVAVSANANVSLIPGAKNRAKYDITCCKHKVFREKRLAPKSNAKSTALFIQTTGHWGFERCVDREGRLLRPKSRGSFESLFRRPRSRPSGIPGATGFIPTSPISGID